MVKLRYFTEAEINTASFGVDNGSEFMSIKALLMLDQLREACGFPMQLTCAYRSLEWDISQGRSGRSTHIQGIAFDIKCTEGWKRSVIVRKAQELGFNGIGVHKDFVHVDLRDDTPVLWLY